MPDPDPAPDLIPGAIPSPNIWNDPDVYELENLASDRAGVIDTTIDALHPLDGADLVIAHARGEFGVADGFEEGAEGEGEPAPERGQLGRCAHS